MEDDTPNNKPSKKRSSNPPNKTIKRKATKVLEKLNTLAKKPRGFSPTDPNLKGIIARLNEGFSVRDCVQVIETKLQDPYFQANPKYIRPTTLFGSPANFESYLNEDPKEYNIPTDGTNRSGLTGTNYDVDMEVLPAFNSEV